jgi:hypothetical protein
MINKVTFGNNSFCGPAVISSLVGVSTDRAVEITHQIRGNTRKVVGMYTSEVCEVLKRLGFNTVYLTHLNKCGSVFYLMSVLDVGQYIVMVPGHFICIEVADDGKRYICDNHTKTPLNVSCQGNQAVKVIKK